MHANRVLNSNYMLDVTVRNEIISKSGTLMSEQSLKGSGELCSYKKDGLFLIQRGILVISRTTVFKVPGIQNFVQIGGKQNLVV